MQTGKQNCIFKIQKEEQLSNYNFIPIKNAFQKRMQNKDILGQTPLPQKTKTKTKTKTWENSPADLPHKKS